MAPGDGPYPHEATRSTPHMRGHAQPRSGGARGSGWMGSQRRGCRGRGTGKKVVEMNKRDLATAHLDRSKRWPARRAGKRRRGARYALRVVLNKQGRTSTTGRILHILFLLPLAHRRGYHNMRGTTSMGSQSGSGRGMCPSQSDASVSVGEPIRSRQCRSPWRALNSIQAERFGRHFELFIPGDMSHFSFYYSLCQLCFAKILQPR